MGTIYLIPGKHLHIMLKMETHIGSISHCCSQRRLKYSAMEGHTASIHTGLRQIRQVSGVDSSTMGRGGGWHLTNITPG